MQLSARESRESARISRPRLRLHDAPGGRRKSRV